MSIQADSGNSIPVDPGLSALAGSGRGFVALGLAVAALTQAVAAILFFYAANWWDMAPALKVVGLDLLLVLCALGALAAPAGGFVRSAWTTAGAVLSGVLLGVHGQIWQTGADAWELFALWSGLAVAWALAARSDAAWLVAVLTATAAALRWTAGVAPPAWLPVQWELTAAALAPLAVGGLWLAVERRDGWLVPVVLALVAACLGLGGLFASDDGPLAVALALAAVTVPAAPPRRRGPWPAAIALVLAVVLLEYLLLREMTGGSGTEEALRLLLAALVMLGGLAVLAVALRRLFGIGGLSPAVLERVLGIGIGIGAWVAVVTAALGVALLQFALSHGERAWPLAVVGGVAALVSRRGQGAFVRHVHAACVVVAYGAVVAEIAFRAADTPPLSDAVVVAAWGVLPLVLLLSREAVAGAVSVLLAVVAAILRVYEVAPAGVAILAAVLALPGWWCVGRLRPSVRAVGMVLLLCAFLVPAGLEFAEPELSWFCRGAAAVAALGLMAAALWTRRDLMQPRLLGAAGLMLGGALVVPAGGAGLVGLAAASARFGIRLLVVLGIALAGWSVVRFYYLLAVPLDRKAALLAAGAVLAGLGWLLVNGRPALARPTRAAVLAILAAALLPAAFEAWDWQGKARIVAEGRQVLLPLRPVDPRSLIQGDYMALAYDMGGVEVAATGGLAALRLDGDGVMVAARPIATPADAAADEVPLRLGPGRHDPRLGPDSFLFQEGAGRDWARARFAVVRIAGGGLVLTGLADEARRPIVPSRETP